MIAYEHPGPHALSEDDAIERCETGRRDLRDSDVLVRMAYVGMNSIDAKLRAKGKATAEHPRILGFERSGWIEAVGPAVSHFAPGGRVAWLGQVDRPGSTAEFTTTTPMIRCVQISSEPAITSAFDRLRKVGVWAFITSANESMTLSL